MNTIYSDHPAGAPKHGACARCGRDTDRCDVDGVTGHIGALCPCCAARRRGRLLFLFVILVCTTLLVLEHGGISF